MDKASFGILKEIKNIDIWDIFGSNVYGYDFRGVSGEWPDMLTDMEKNHQRFCYFPIEEDKSKNETKSINASDFSWFL